MKQKPGKHVSSSFIKSKDKLTREELEDMVVMLTEYSYYVSEDKDLNIKLKTEKEEKVANIIAKIDELLIKDTYKYD